MRSRFLPSLLALAAGAIVPNVQAAVVFSLADSGRSLVRFDSATPGLVTTIGSLSGATSTLNGLDFRPADGMLYGFSAGTSGIYRINTATGATSLVSTSTTPIATPQLGLDFNPTVDRLRLVSGNDDNLRINVDTGAAIVDGTLAYAAGDANAGANPSIVDAAYTNNDNNPATGTTLYYIDMATNTLVTTAAPNAGTLNTVGGLGVDANAFTGFDIFSDGSLNFAFASFQVGGVDALYSVNLTSGMASLIGAIGASQLFGLAVMPNPIPEPGTAALLAMAGLAVLASRRRRAAAPDLQPLAG